MLESFTPYVRSVVERSEIQRENHFDIFDIQSSESSGVYATVSGKIATWSFPIEKSKSILFLNFVQTKV